MEEQTEVFTFVGIEELFEVGSLNVYPNPAKDQLNIAFNALEVVELEISLNDVAGRKIMQRSYLANRGDHSLRFDLTTIPIGIYFLNVSTNESSPKYKVVVQ